MTDQLLQSAWQAHQAGNHAETARICQEIRRSDPANFSALFLGGFAYSVLGRYEEAERLMDEAAKVNPQSPEAIYNRGCMLRNLGRHGEALQCFERALALKPDFLDAQINRGIALLMIKRHGEALAVFDKVVKAAPDDAEGWNNRANALIELKRLEEALASLDRAIALRPDYDRAWNNRGITLYRLKRYEESLASLDRALAVNPQLSAAINNRGNTLMALRRFEEAAYAFDRASAPLRGAGGTAASDGGSIDALINYGTALLTLKRPDEAIAMYTMVLERQPENTEALCNRANALVTQKRYAEAVKDCDAILKLEPEFKYMRGIAAHCRLNCCDWSALENDKAEIAAGLKAGKLVVPPLEVAAIASTAKEQSMAARIAFADRHPPSANPLWRGEIYTHKRIRLAYLSADLREHVVSNIVAGVFEHHDRERFETIALSFRASDRSPMRRRVEAAFDRFIDVERKSDSELAQLVREMEIDIAVDLMGYSGECRPGVFAHRPAPIQVNYLGYAGTMGAEYFDYVIADATIIPQGDEAYYSEHIARLPDAYLPYDSKRAPAPAAPTRAQAGLPRNGFVFASFNNSYKFRPESFDIWMRLLRSVEDSVLWLSAMNPEATRNLAREAQARGVDPARLVFAPFMPSPADHLARLSLADLFLDTFPFNAHTTAMDALVAGVPLLTFSGQSFAGRVAASLNIAAGLSEMVTYSVNDYEFLALKLARDQAALGAIRAKLGRNRSTSPLFDTAGYTRNLEAAYATMYERYRRGDAPDSFTVDSPLRH
jgi:predicted O-linked N-acetylglucosamine transferase (SPINDLY family)